MRPILLACLTATIPAFADDAVAIKIKVDPDLGKTVRYQSADTATGSTKFFGPDGKLLLEQKKEGGEKAYRSTVLARDKNGKATKEIRIYEKAAEKEDGKTKVFSYQGRTLVIEKLGDKYRIGVVGDKPLDPKDVEELHKDLGKKSSAKALLGNLAPAKPVKVGDSWEIPMKPLIEAFEEMPGDLEKSSAKAKLVKVYDKGKRRFGTFEVTMKFVILGKTDKDGAVIEFSKPGELDVELTVDIAIDGSSVERKESGNLALKGEAAMTTNGQKLKVVFDVKGTGGDEVSAEVDDPKGREVGKVVYAPMPGEWSEFAVKDHGFKVKFPGSPNKKADTNDRGITTTEYSVQTDQGRVYYSVTVSEYPPDKFKIDPATAYGNLKSAKNIKESKDIKIAGHEAIELKQELKKEVLMHITQRVVIVGERMYQLIVVAAEGRKSDAKQFFDSFQLDPKAVKKDD